MTKKDYIKFAAILARDKPERCRYADIPDHAFHVLFNYWSVLATQTADIFAADNPRFDRVRFLAACGLTKE